MTLTTDALTALDSHWAVSAIGQPKLDRASQLASERLARQALGRQIAFKFDQIDIGDAPTRNEEDLLRWVVLALELAALDGLDDLVHSGGAQQGLGEQAVAASRRAFELRRLLPVPTEVAGRILAVLQLSALAYCGDRWPDLRRWYVANEDSLKAPSEADVQWDTRVLYRLFHCWTRLFQAKGWDDLDRVRDIIAGLREDQVEHEQGQFRDGSDAENKATALRLIAMYHWAKATEVLAQYILHGDSVNPAVDLDTHFESGSKAAASAGDAELEVSLRFLHASAHVMVRNSLWWAVRRVNSKTSEFVRSLARRDYQPRFQLLPPQRAALLEQGLLDQAKTAIVVDMPTSGGKTLLAQFRILQALNQFRDTGGWVAYVAPTRALCAQITRRLRRDFQPIGIRVEQLTSAVEVDAFEKEILTADDGFDVLVSTPEKLSLAIRNKSIERKLALLVMDEAHNLEAEEHGLRMELFLATVKRDCQDANFLLLMPFGEGIDDIARWLAHDDSAANAISLDTSAWKPNERILGIYKAVVDESEAAGWHLEFETLTVTPKAMQLKGTHRVGGVRPLGVAKRQVIRKGRQDGLSAQTAAIASALCQRGTSIAIANRISSVWAMARLLEKSLPVIEDLDRDVRLVQDFLRTEIAEDFELVEMLNHGIGVHHEGLSDETRALMEWLAESGQLKVLCATTTVAQGIDFPVSSVFLASKTRPGIHKSVEMTPREFWNLAGRAGRIGHDSVGVVGIAEGTDRSEIVKFVQAKAGALASRLVTLIDDLAREGQLDGLEDVLWKDQWEDFRCYVAHLCADAKNLDAVSADSEQLLRNTYGYTTLRADPTRREQAEALLDATRAYASKYLNRERLAQLADSTGFSPEGVQKAISALNALGEKLRPDDWAPESLFGSEGRMADLFGVMLNVPQIRRQLADSIRGSGDKGELSGIARDWVNGNSIKEIAVRYFSEDTDPSDTRAITEACRTIYSGIASGGAWGVSAIGAVAEESQKLNEDERRQLDALPAMIYHGVRSEEGILMRMNSVPRSVAVKVGALYRKSNGTGENYHSVGHAREFLKEMDAATWGRVRPASAALSGDGYRRVWSILSGEGQ